VPFHFDKGSSCVEEAANSIKTSGILAQTLVKILQTVFIERHLIQETDRLGGQD